MQLVIRHHAILVGVEDSEKEIEVIDIFIAIQIFEELGARA